MKSFATLLLFMAVSASLSAQTTIANGGFETWGNASPGISSEPTGWFSNKSGTAIAMAGPQTCYQDNTIFRSGTSSVRVETKTVPIVGTVVNGNVTTGVINAPTITKTDGYIGTVNASTTTDVRRMAFTGRPDSLVGWYQYTQGGAAEQGKVRAILHTGDYFDPETPTTYHADPTSNKVANALFLTPAANAATWTRFSVPFTYAATSAPAYIMINITSSADQATTTAGSKLWIDDLQVIYKPNGVDELAKANELINIFAHYKTINVDLTGINANGVSLNVYDVTGRVVHTQAMQADRLNSFELPFVASGMYIYQLSGDGIARNGRLILQ